MCFRNIKLIVGLANPFIKYHHTRHNVGSWFVQRLASFYKKVLKEDKRFLGYTGSLFQSNSKVLLFIPNVFMNVCSRSIMIISNFYHIRSDELLVAHDELDLEPGLVRFKFGHGHNGHNGVRNIIDVLTKKNNFLRIQIGIGRPKEIFEISNFVLSPPTLNEKNLIEKSIHRAVHATNILIQEKHTLTAQDFLKNFNVIDVLSSKELKF
ncbi:hypothetical protein XW81_00900 [Buchnera aphidicola (Schlechtendalia chinensis)]|uniref:Peptidyl-tRNA hydrolase n=1 Tax=Buchnera aphidicola subsp. Schlechtendalia chinensis TaxID=118110 RepID=A0A172WDG7_BUCSC|nr:aminoacyl-tRNA hydrolase [Buchnera aphidicola]ANF16982.1 hypothetical protein XW81_00900 [Buchnera aphidicola (Schlechtendalia chinensis)]